MAFDLVRGGKQNGAAAQFFAIFHALNANQAPAFGCLVVFAEAQFLADIGFFLACHFAEAQIIQRVAVIKISTCDMALFDAQRSQCLKALRLNVQWMRRV